MKLNTPKYSHRLLARIIIEAETPLAIGSGQSDILTDALVALDANRLPYIPGTSLAGVVRSMLDPKRISEVYGYQKTESEGMELGLPNTGRGSEVIFSEARILNSRNEVVDGVVHPALIDQDPLLCEYRRMLPIRQHVSINEKGTAKDTGKFDQQVVFAGTRFCFELEMLSEDTKNVEHFLDVLNAVHHKSFRIGGGVHNGFGKINVIDTKTAMLDLTQPEDRAKYLCKSSSLAEKWPHWGGTETGKYADTTYITYTLRLQPDSFFFFGSGFGDAAGNADMTTVKETRVDWASGTGKLQYDQLLIPAASVKGALRHRVAYRYNQLTGRYVDSDNGLTPQKADENDAVRSIFGYQDNRTLAAGKILLSDIIETPADHKLITHVSIDRFTGGAIDGALFTEQVDYASDRNFILDILVERNAFPEDNENIQKAFELALDDLCHGLLPLGGGTSRGNGIFTGTYTKNEEE